MNLRLSRSAEAAGFSVEFHDTIGSTNDEAMRRAMLDAPDRRWFVAGEQTSGRGRHGRHWTSPRGNLYASLLLVDPAPLARTPQLGFVAGLALVSAVRPFLANDPRLALKWPNDLVHEGAKLAGILLGGSRLPDGRFACVIGMGVNCVSHPEGLAYRTQDLVNLGASCNCVDVFEALSVQMARWLDKWGRGDHFDAIRAAWLHNAAGVGGQIRVSVGQENLEGIFETIDQQGRLVLRTPQGARIIEAGDVFLPGARKPLRVEQET